MSKKEILKKFVIIFFVTLSIILGLSLHYFFGIPEDIKWIDTKKYYG